MRYLEKYYPYIITAIAFAIYITTLAPSVAQIDSGELATVQYTLGIAHPTGYPLFTLLGRFAVMILFPFKVITALNLLAAIWVALSVFFLIKATYIVVDNCSVNNLRNDIKIIISSTSILILSFSRTFWLQSGSVEVYSLQLFIFSFLLFQLINIFFKDTVTKMDWFIIAFILALGFSNHMTTLLTLPGIAFIYFKKEGFNKSSLIFIPKMILLFLFILIPLYLYLPIRANANPVLNWGNPTDFESFWRHFTGRQYQVWLFASIDAAKKQLVYFLSNFPNEFTYAGILLLVIGAYEFIKRKKDLAYFSLINFFFTIFYSINYDINDLDSYFLFAYANVAFFIAFGFLFIYELLKQNKLRDTILFGVSILTVVFVFISNYRYADQSDLFTFEDYTKSVMNSLPENSVVFSYQWDYLISPAYYFQYVENERRDVVFVDKELLRRSWYYNQLQHNYPFLLSNLDKEVNIFLEALKPFERNEKFNAALLENYYRRIMTGLIETNIQNHPYYIAPEVIDNEYKKGELIIPAGYTIAPDLFMYKVIKIGKYNEAPLPNFKIRFPNVDNKYTAMLKNIISGMLLRRALYELQNNKLDRAAIYVKKVASDFKNVRIPVQLRRLL